MNRTVMLLIVCLLPFLISGCSTKVIFVPTSCNIGEVDHASVDYKAKPTLLEEAKRCARNYTAVKEENEILRKTIDACR